MISVFLSGITIFLTIPGFIYAQTGSRDEAFGTILGNISYAHNEKGNGPNNVPALTTKDRLKAAKMEARASRQSYKMTIANFRAQESFQKNFKDITNVRWEIQNDARFATFRKDDIKTTVAYNKRGAWTQTLNYMSAAQLPQNVRSLVQRDFPGDHLTFGVRVKQPGVELYIVQTETSKTLRQLAICDGSVEVIKELGKAL